MDKETLSALAGTIFLLGYLLYVWGIIRGRVVPSRASWIAWTACDTLAVIGMREAGTLNYQATAAMIGAWITLAIVLFRGQSGWELKDKLSIAGAAAGIILWQTLDNPLLAVLASQGALFTGAISEFGVAARKPEEEDKTTWMFWWISCFFQLAALESWSVAEAAQPLNFLAIESVMVYLLWVRPRFKFSPSTQKEAP